MRLVVGLLIAAARVGAVTALVLALQASTRPRPVLYLAILAGLLAFLPVSWSGLL